jgi:pimeloyl-ACP methyl ester carboxylesterase
MVTAEDFDTSGVFDLVAKRHRVIAFDRPGFGYSDRPHGSAWSAGTQADLLRDAFAIIGINRFTSGDGRSIWLRVGDVTPA